MLLPWTSGMNPFQQQGGGAAGTREEFLWLNIRCPSAEPIVCCKELFTNAAQRTARKSETTSANPFALGTDKSNTNVLFSCLGCFTISLSDWSNSTI